MMASRRVKVFFDGGSRPNPGRMEAAVVIRGAVHLFDDLGTGSNTDAEWHALILALELAQEAGISDIELIGDSRPVITQANAVLAGHPRALPQAARLKMLANRTPPARIRWIKREQNLAGIALAARHPR